MAARSYPDCATCDHNYRSTFRALTSGLDITVYDLDLVLEANRRIFGIGEWKRSLTEYKEYYCPAFEYVGAKKFGKLLKVPPYLFWEIVGKDRFLIWEIDRFERDRELRSVSGGVHGAIKMAVFDPDDAITLDKAAFEEWFAGVVGSVGGSA